MTCTFKPLSGKQKSLVVNGDLRDFRVKIVDEATSQIVARIHRKAPSVTQPISGTRQTCTMTVASNVDVAIIVMIWICLDELPCTNYWNL
jgi:uncharacterized protein YxjI